jgi:hypothetical protein
MSLRQKVYSIMLYPSITSSVDALSRAIAAHKFVIIVGRCHAEYEGRGASKLGLGDRVVIVKPDGAVLVHRPTGYSPVNWQPTSHVINVEERDGKLMLRSVRDRPREVLVVYFDEVYLLAVLDALEDKAEFIEYLDEREIRDYLYEHPEEIEDGFKPLSKEKPVGEGYVDILGVDKDNRLVVIEIKRVNAGADAVRQLHRYVETIHRENPDVKVRGILIAPSISKDARVLLNSLGLEFKQINLQQLYKKVRRIRHEKTQTRGLWDFIKK